MIEGFELVGYCGVDTATIIIGDPCNVCFDSKNMFENMDVKQQQPYICQINYEAGHPGAGVLLSSGYGDGYYPVYIRKNEDDRIVEVRILFDEDEDETNNA